MGAEENGYIGDKLTLRASGCAKYTVAPADKGM